MRRLVRPWRQEQRGQVLPIFALVAVFMVGAVSLAVDYGFLADQHRNLQAFADHAAIAGAEQLNTNGTTTSARRYALIYIRDNLGISKAAFDLGGTKADCFNPPDQPLASDIVNCALPAPYNNYSVDIRSPGPANQANGSGPLSISVSISDSVTNGMAAVIGIPKSTVGAFAEARTYPPGARLTGALYTDGCINTSTSSLVGTPLIVDGDVYVNQCTVAQTGLVGGFCAFPTPTQAGNLIFGPTANPPAGLVLNLGLGCSVPLAGLLNLGVGNALQVPNSAFPTGLPAPPPPTKDCGNCTATYPCLNGTVDATGVTPGVPPSPPNCYQPGFYSTTTGHLLDNVKNNLNPGVYYVDVSSGGCYNDATVTSCGGVAFAGNTMNANLNGVINHCWNNGPLGGFGLTAATQTFNAPCPDGLIYDPTRPVDPQCNPTGVAVTPAASAPAFAASPDLSVGSLAGPVWVRLSARSVMGESDAADAAEKGPITPGINGAISVSITRSASATAGYNVYVGPQGREALVRSVAQPLLLNPPPVIVTAPAAAGAQHYPLFDNSSCTTGFHNIPHSKDQVPGTLAAPNQNFGVTFVLTGKAGLCMGTNTLDGHCLANLPGPGITVLLQPYCSGGFTPQPESLACSGAGVAGPTLEDGVYTVYGTSEGAIHTSPSQPCGLLCPTTGLMGMTGTVYLPRGSIVEDTGSMFSDTPGQAILHDVTSNLNLGLLTPFAYANSTVGAFLPPGVFLIQ